MKKRFISRAVAVCLMLSCLLGSFTVYAANVSEEEALKAAQKAVSSKAVLIDSDWDKDDTEWEFEFRTKDKKTEYDVTVNGKTGKVRQVEMEKKGVKAAKKYSVSKKAAKKAVTKAFEGSKITKVKKKTDDGSKVYSISFKTSAFKGCAKVHGKSGKVIEWKKKF